MTSQIEDTVCHCDRWFNIAGVSGSQLFTPDEVGLRVAMLGSHCWHGYYCEYVLRDDQLHLAKVSFGLHDEDRDLAESGKGPVCFGTVPKRSLKEPIPRLIGERARAGKKIADKYWSNWYFEPDYPINFSGGLLIASDFIEKMYVHMGFAAAYAYREVHELVFEGGGADIRI